MFLTRKQHTDPNTGDIIGLGERMSLFAQSLMRRWSFIIAMTVVTVLWWTHPLLFGGSDAQANTRWQDWASYMALLIESLVGIGMFGWARRDSQILRRILKLEKDNEQDQENDHVLLHETYRLVVETRKMLDEFKEENGRHSR